MFNVQLQLKHFSQCTESLGADELDEYKYVHSLIFVPAARSKMEIIHAFRKH